MIGNPLHPQSIPPANVFIYNPVLLTDGDQWH